MIKEGFKASYLALCLARFYPLALSILDLAGEKRDFNVSKGLGSATIKSFAKLLRSLPLFLASYSSLFLRGFAAPSCKFLSY